MAKRKKTKKVSRRKAKPKKKAKAKKKAKKRRKVTPAKEMAEIKNDLKDFDNRGFLQTHSNDNDFPGDVDAAEDATPFGNEADDDLAEMLNE